VGRGGGDFRQCRKSRGRAMDYVKFAYRTLASRAARHVLVGRSWGLQSPDLGRFTREDVDGRLNQAWVDDAKRAKRLPPEPKVGSRMNVGHACSTISFFEALRLFGTDRKYAINLVTGAAWRV
jgi:hypothetical protein